MVKVIEEVQNDLQIVKLLDEHSGSFLSIVPYFGANVNGLAFNKNDTLYSINDGNTCLADFSGINMFKGAKLIPFANWLENGTYVFNGEAYKLPKNYPEENNACHGFLYDKKFNIEKTETVSEQASITLGFDYFGQTS